MTNTEGTNQLPGLIEKEETQKVTDHLLTPTMHKRRFQSYQEKREAKLLSLITSQITNAPTFAEELRKQGEFVLDVSKEMAEKLASGEISFGTYSDSGTKYAQFINSKTGKIFKNIPVKELPVSFGPSIALAGLSMKLQEISHELDLLGEKIDKVNRNFDLNRYAEVQSAKETFEIAMLTKNPDSKKALLHNALTQATSAKSLSLNQLIETKMQLKTQDKFNLFTSKLSAAEGDKLATIALENLSYMKDAFSIQIAALFELAELDALHYTVDKVKETILQDFSGKDALFLDEHLSISSNPFKFLSNNVVGASNSIVEFLDQNEDLLEVSFIPELLEISYKGEINFYGSKSL